jgi:prolyl 4-hydroxylase
MDNYIRVYRDVLDQKKCALLIKMFEEDTAFHEVQNNGRGATLTQINLLETAKKTWNDEAKILEKAIISCVRRYRKSCGIDDSQWPEHYDLEPPKMKRYLPRTSDEFPDHVDVKDYRTAKRFLVAFIYLSDHNNASTVISPKDEQFVSECKAGSMLLFPPMWPWRHAGLKPVNNPNTSSAVICITQR